MILISSKTSVGRTLCLPTLDDSKQGNLLRLAKFTIFFKELLFLYTVPKCS